MRSISAVELLDLWEQGLGRSNVYKAMLLMAKANPQIPQEDLAGISIGHRDTILLSLREKIFGSQLQCRAICPDCGEPLEFTLGTEDIRAIGKEDFPIRSSLIFGDYQVDFRLPDSFDLLAIADLTDLSSARQALIKRCLTEVRFKGGISSADLPLELEDEISNHMAKVDPLGDLQLELVCPCSYRWIEVFDIATFFWSEIQAWADRTFRDVHLLATYYGWSEAEILAMSQMRRQIYLEMIS